MSQIKATTLSNLAGSKTVPTDTVVDGSAKAWVNFNGTGTVAIRRAFNVSSITDNGTGDYTVNFTNAMVDANYVPMFSTTGTNTTDTTRAMVLYGSDPSGATVKSASAFRFLRGGTTATGGMTDGAEVNVAIFS
jgi:hypothetical protein